MESLFNKMKFRFVAWCAFVTVVFSAPIATAGPYGFDLHNVLSPRAAGMAGTNIAGETGVVSSLYGNPANLNDYQGGTNFMFGATLYHPEARAEHDGKVTSLAGGDEFYVKSNAEPYAVPQIAVAQDLAGIGIPLVIGAGLSAPAGIGVHWRGENNTLGAGAEFIVLGINLGAGYEVSEALDVGAALTVSYGMLEAGVAGSSGQGHDYGVRLTVGADYHLTDSTDIGFYYQTELEHRWDNFLLLGNEADGSDAGYRALTVDQPANVAVGFAHEITENTRVKADVIYKFWSQAKFWDRFYHDQTASSIGVEHDRGPWTFRAGYGYANDPTKKVEVSALEGYNFTCTGHPGGSMNCLPLTGDVGEGVWTYLQAMETPVIYEHRVTAGFTYEGFLAPFLTLDMHAAHQIQEDSDYVVDNATIENSVTALDVQSWHVGFALTWGF